MWISIQNPLSWTWRLAMFAPWRSQSSLRIAWYPITGKSFIHSLSQPTSKKGSRWNEPHRWNAITFIGRNNGKNCCCKIELRTCCSWLQKERKSIARQIGCSNDYCWELNILKLFRLFVFFLPSCKEQRSNIRTCPYSWSARDVIKT